MLLASILASSTNLPRHKLRLKILSKTKRFIKKGGVALFDQGLLSATNLLIALALIKFASKEEYGVYILLFTPILLAIGLQNALLNSPFTTLYGQSTSNDQINYSSSLFYGHIFLGVILFFASLILFSIYSLITYESINAFLIFSFAFAILGSLAREGSRAFFYSKKQVYKAFIGDVWYSLLTLGSISAIFFIFKIELKASYVLLAIGFGGIVPSLYQYIFTEFTTQKLNKLIWIDFWKLGKWALQGVILTWINLNSYPYLVAIIFSVAAVADIAASRLFWMPVALVMASWSTIFRPYITEWFSQQEFYKIKLLSYSSIGISVIAFSIYLVLIFILYPFIEAYFFDESYADLKLLSSLWGLFFFIQFIRSVLMASLMVNEIGYKKLSLMAWLGLGTILLLIPVLGSLPILSIIILLIFTELVQIAYILFNIKSYWGETFHLSPSTNHKSN